MLANDSLYDIVAYKDQYGNLKKIQRDNKPFLVSGNKIDTGEVLVQLDHLYITGLYEIPFQQQLTNATQFKVDYNNGLVYFYELSQDGKVLDLSFSASGQKNVKAINTTLIDQGNHYPIKTAEAALQQTAQRIDNLVLNTNNPAEVGDAHIDGVNNVVDTTLKARLDRHALDIQKTRDTIGTMSNIPEDNIVEAIQNDRTKVSNFKIINVKDFGAKGDALTNDTNAIQNAINSVGAGNSALIYFPAGTYIVSSGFTISTNIVIKGAGIFYNRNYRLFGKDAYNQNMRPNITTIKFDTPKSNVTMFTVVDAGVDGKKYGVDFTVEDIMLDGSDGIVTNTGSTTPKTKDVVIQFTGSGANGLNLTDSSFCTLKNVAIIGFSGYGFKTGIWQEHLFVNITLCGTGVVIEKGDGGLTTPYISYCKTAIQIGTSTAEAVTERINNCRIEWCEEYGIRLENASSIDITGFIDRCGYAGIAGGMFTSEIWSTTIRATIQRCGAVYRGVDPTTLVEADYKMASNVCINNARALNTVITSINSGANDDGSGGNVPCIGEIYTRGVNITSSNTAQGFSGYDTSRKLVDCTYCYHVVNAQPLMLNGSGDKLMSFDNNKMSLDLYTGYFFRPPFNWGVPADSVGVDGNIVYDSQNSDLYIKKGSSWKKVLTT